MWDALQDTCHLRGGWKNCSHSFRGALGARQSTQPLPLLDEKAGDDRGKGPLEHEPLIFRDYQARVPGAFI